MNVVILTILTDNDFVIIKESNYNYYLTDARYSSDLHAGLLSVSSAVGDLNPSEI